MPRADSAVGMSGSMGIVPGGYFAGLLGRQGEPPQCKVIGDEIAVHWFPTNALPGARCLCGATVRTDEDGQS